VTNKAVILLELRRAMLIARFTGTIFFSNSFNTIATMEMEQQTRPVSQSLPLLILLKLGIVTILPASLVPPRVTLLLALLLMCTL